MLFYYEEDAFWCGQLPTRPANTCVRIYPKKQSF